jgi:molybdate transport system regulatory protein
MGKNRFNLHAELTVRVGDDMFANARRIELLRQIDQLGNLTQAAKQVGYSYKGAWDAIDDMTRLSGGTLIERHAGGKGGGGTHLTERGQQVLRNFSLIQAEHARFIARLDALANGLSNDYAMENEIAMRTSARNQFAGILVSITPGAVNDELGILVNGSQTLIASITHESCRELQLAVGAKVFALIKASAVVLRSPEDADAANLNQAIQAARAAIPKNAFISTVHTIVPGEHQSELAVLLESGLIMVTTMPNKDVDAMGIDLGAVVMATIEPSNVIIGIAA